jgi:hypothetical protein
MTRGFALEQVGVAQLKIAMGLPRVIGGFTGPVPVHKADDQRVDGIRGRGKGG